MSWESREEQELIADEGKELTSYKDTEGYWTVGIGHLLGNNPEYANITITEEQCQDYFDEDVAEATRIAESVDCFAGLDGPRKGALVNMAFELGNKLTTFHAFLNYLDLGQYKEAAVDLMTTAYAKQVPQRAKRIAYRIQYGQYVRQ